MQLNWLKKIYEQMMWQYEENRLPQAILLEGRSGIGKKETLLFFLKSIFAKPQLIESEAHPDFLHVNEKLNMELALKINQFAQKKPQFEKRKVILVEDVTSVNIQASNALLKTIEEADNTLFLMTTTNKELILTTILSRCQLMKCFGPNPEEAKEYIGIQDDFVKTCMLYGLGPVFIKENFELLKEEFEKVLFVLESILIKKDISGALLHLKDINEIQFMNWLTLFCVEFENVPEFLSFQFHIARSIRVEFYNKILFYKERVTKNVGINKKSVIETLLIILFELQNVPA